MKSSRGFTIVELLIVIVVIGILAAIVIVAFNGVQNRANGTSVKSDLAALAKKIEMAKTDSLGEVYPSSSLVTSTAANGLGFKFTKDAYLDEGNNLPYCRSTDGKRYGVAARAKGGEAYYISSEVSGVQPYTWAWTNTAATTCDKIAKVDTGGSSTDPVLVPGGNSWGLSTNSTTKVTTWNWAN